MGNIKSKELVHLSLKFMTADAGSAEEDELLARLMVVYKSMTADERKKAQSSTPAMAEATAHLVEEGSL